MPSSNRLPLCPSSRISSRISRAVSSSKAARSASSASRCPSSPNHSSGGNREADGVLFSGRYGLQGGAVGGAAAKLHLDDHECVFVARDQVELPAAGAVVALDDLVAFTGEVAARYLLAEISGVPVVRAPTPA